MFSFDITNAYKATCPKRNENVASSLDLNLFLENFQKNICKQPYLPKIAFNKKP